MWNEIKAEGDINNLMERFGYFHDSCIKEMRYISGAFVDRDLSMHAINNCRNLRIIFQKQSINPMVIELEFSNLIKLDLEPNDDNYTCEILDVSMFIENGHIYWGDSAWFALKRNDYQGTWLCSKNARWRVADKYIGKEEVYIAK